MITNHAKRFTAQKKTDEKGSNEKQDLTETTTENNECCRTNNITMKDNQQIRDQQTLVKINKTPENYWNT